jgi:hypothetical protein
VFRGVFARSEFFFSLFAPRLRVSLPTQVCDKKQSLTRAQTRSEAGVRRPASGRHCSCRKSEDCGEAGDCVGYHREAAYRALDEEERWRRRAEAFASSGRFLRAPEVTAEEVRRQASPAPSLVRQRSGQTIVYGNAGPEETRDVSEDEGDRFEEDDEDGGGDGGGDDDDAWEDEDQEDEVDGAGVYTRPLYMRFW